MKHWLVLLSFCCASTSWAQEGLPPEGQFQRGLADIRQGHFAPGASALFPWVKSAPRVHPHRSWAQLYLAHALTELGLRHAGAVLNARIVLDRENPEAVLTALEALVAALQFPHDHLLIDEGVFASLDAASLPETVAATVRLRQVLRDLRAGQTGWAKPQLALLPDNSPQEARAQFAMAAAELSAARPPLSKLSQQFMRLGQRPNADIGLRNEALLAHARLQYELKDFAAARRAYESVALPRLAVGRAQLYIEEAWTRYRGGDLHGAMEILVPLETPAFRDELLPDKYIIRALVYRDLCVYGASRKQTQALAKRFETSLTRLADHRPLEGDPQLLKATLADGPTKRANEFSISLETERNRLSALSGLLSEPLLNDLRELYSLSLAEAQRELALARQSALEHAADDLLRAADHARRVDYEVGLHLNARRPYPGKAMKDSPPPAKNEDVTPFHGELWNDELRSVRFHLPSRCEGK